MTRILLALQRSALPLPAALLVAWTFTIAASAQPASLSVQPSSGSGATQTFAFSGNSPNGFAYIDYVNIIFNWSVDGTYGCYILYSRTANVIYLVNDDGAQWLGGSAPGTAGSVQNSQCTLDIG